MLKAKTTTFKGANVFLSRNLVPPEVFDALLDALKLNAAQVFLCCDPSRNAPLDFHVISSPHHEKFEDLRAKGCNLLGPQCVLTCAKEHRALPKQGFTCCLAMDGIKVLASGFDMDEKVKIEKMVTAMGGILQTKATLDISFVIVKNVLAAKYKWALNVLKKPIVTINWLSQCWNEHRIVPQESYKVLPFSGLTICVTRILADERKKMEKLTIENGGKYSPELTKKCTHLISDAPEGDKYKVALRWGHINIVTRKWFDQSVARRACLNEESYPVQGGSVSSNKTLRCSLKAQHSQDRCIGNSLSVPASVAGESTLPDFPSTGISDTDFEATLSQNMSSMFSDPSAFVKDGDNEIPAVQATNETNLDYAVANDSQSEESDLYLSECRISLVGFEASELRKLVNMVRNGGGSRYMSFNEKLTHIVVGNPSELEKKELRILAASGVINVVRTTWLEDCNREKKEIPVLRQHAAYDLLLPKDSVSSIKGTTIGMNELNQGKMPCVRPTIPTDELAGTTNSMNGVPSPLERSGEEKLFQQNLLPVVNDQIRNGKRTKPDLSFENVQSQKSNVFKGKTFRFSKSFPDDRRAEIVQWISQGGGEVVEGYVKQNVDFTIECHGVVPDSADILQSCFVSSHWVRSSLEDGCMLDVGSHIIYSPLPCQIPLPGFEKIRFCVSQYDEKERILLRNLCFVLGAKFVEKLTRKVTHLLCKFASGPKYEAACKWGITSISSDWIYECIRKNDIVATDLFHPKEVTSEDQEAGLCTVSQFPTQAVRMISGESSSQITTRSSLRNATTQVGGSTTNSRRNEVQECIDNYKKARLLENDDQKGLLSSKVHLSGSMSNMSPTGGNNSKGNEESSHGVPDVAAAIEDLLEQTSKIHDLKSPGRTGCDKSVFSSDCSMRGEDHGTSHSVIGLPKMWLNRTGKKDDLSNPPRDVNGGIYDGFSETQTESQVVGYEEDLSGRQMLIDRVRTRSSMI